MRLFAGLGNPGTKYERNRHNIGFMALDHIAADHGFSPWRARFQGLVAEGRLGREKVVLLKPQTFMNLSGQSIGATLHFFKLAPADMVVFHDELDLAPGKCRFKQGGGHAGHNGLRSIHAHVGDAYSRVRLGIGHPGHKDRVAAYVLHDFARADEGWLNDLMRGLPDGAPALAEGDAARFMNAVSLRVAPPRSSGGNGARAVDDKTGGGQASGEKTGGGQTEALAPAPTGTNQADRRSPLEKLKGRFR